MNLSVEAGSFGTVNLRAVLQNLPSDPPTLYNSIAALPQQGSQSGGCKAGFLSSKFSDTCRYALGLMTSEADLNMVNAIRGQIESVTTGVTPAGLIPFESSPTATAQYPNFTGEVLGFVQNPLRPNGGFYSRFPGLSEFLGVNPEMPAAGRYKSADGKVALNLSTLDVSWAYDPSSDLPEVVNLLSFANSALAALPINLLTGSDTKLVIADAAGNPTTTTDLGIFLARSLQISPATLLGAPPDGRAYYITAVSDQLPILTPMRLPQLLVNAALSALNSPYLLGNPAADALDPALKILINTAYTDVLPPDRLSECATQCGTSGARTFADLGYQAYDRSFLTGAIPTPFRSVEPLTPEQQDAAQGAAADALKAGIQEQLDKPFWGIIVPNPDNPPEVTPPATVQAAAAAPVESDEVAAPVVSESVVESTEPDSASTAEVSALVAVVAPPIQTAATADAPAPASRAGSHRGRASAEAGASDGTGGAASSGRHRATS